MFKHKIKYFKIGLTEFFIKYQYLTNIIDNVW